MIVNSLILETKDYLLPSKQKLQDLSRAKHLWQSIDLSLVFYCKNTA